MTALCRDLKLARALKLLLCVGGGRGSGGADVGTSETVLESKVGLIMLGGGGGGALVEAGSGADDATENCKSYHY